VLTGPPKEEEEEEYQEQAEKYLVGVKNKSQVNKHEFSNKFKVFTQTTKTGKTKS
jgi:hypothetical protein